MRIFPSWISLLVAGALLAACSGIDKDLAELEGSVPVLLLEEQVLIDPELNAEELIVPPAYANPEWAQTAGEADHALHHVAAPADLKRDWRIKASSRKAKDAPITAAPIVSNGRIFLIDSVAAVRAFDAQTGKRLWSTELTPNTRDRKTRRYNIFARSNPGYIGFGGGAAIEGNLLFVTSGFGFVAALNADDGEVVWKAEAPGPLRNPPTIGDGLVIAVTISNEVIALEQGTGTQVWTYESFEEPARFLASAAPAISEESVIVPFSSGEVTSLAANNGRIQWSAVISRTSRLNALSTLGDVAGSPVVDRGAIFSVTQSGQMTGIDARTGTVAWEQPVGGYHTPWLAGETLFVASNRNLLTAVNRIDGRIRWTTQLDQYENENKRTDRIVWAGPVLAGGKLYLTSTTGQMIAADPISGEIVDRYRLKDGSTLPPVVADGRLYVLTQEGHIEAFEQLPEKELRRKMARRAKEQEREERQRRRDEKKAAREAAKAAREAEKAARELEKQNGEPREGRGLRFWRRNRNEAEEQG
ncbi:MAG: PQQ-binding-like beta-propeller repeat protein [Pseudomonadota bacterium]